MRCSAALGAYLANAVNSGKEEQSSAFESMRSCWTHSGHAVGFNGCSRVVAGKCATASSLSSVGYAMRGWHARHISTHDLKPVPHHRPLYEGPMERCWPLRSDPSRRCGIIAFECRRLCRQQDGLDGDLSTCWIAGRYDHPRTHRVETLRGIE